MFSSPFTTSRTPRISTFACLASKFWRKIPHGGVFLTIGDGTHVIDLVQLPGEQPPSAPQSMAEVRPALGFGHVAFPVEDALELRHAYRELIDNQIPVLAAIDHESQESIYFCDPDGNMLEIYWERPNAREIFQRGRKDQDKSIIFEPDYGP